MGTLSDTYSRYKDNLDASQKDYDNLLEERYKSTEKFHEEFLNQLILSYGDVIESKVWREKVIDRIKKFFSTDRINFVAIDGSCDKHVSAEYISFYGGAYGSKGTLSLGTDPVEIEYKRWEMEKDVSMVAFVPVPYSQLDELADPSEPHFFVSDSEKIDITNIHLPMMQLAEVFLGYNSATNSNLDKPELILMDNSISGILGSNDFKPDDIGLRSHPASSIVLEIEDIAIAQAHPFNSLLEVPGTSHFNLGFAVVRVLHNAYGKKEFSISEIESELKVSNGIPDTIFKLLENRKIIEFDKANQKIIKKVEPRDSWEKTKEFFQSVCKRIFIDKIENAMRFDRTDKDGETHRSWMNSSDVKFLIGLGMRAMIETCWERKILLTGIMKDSNSTYFSKNYLGVCMEMDAYPELKNFSGKLPPTDRLLCEMLPYMDKKITSPWGTVEFDSTFMVVHAEKNNGKSNITGTMGFITRPERLFLKSLAQFYLKRSDEKMLTGHAIFVDRLAYPELDDSNENFLDVKGEKAKGLGELKVFFYKDKTIQNSGQAITYFLLHTVTKNHFPEVIGYPDPLHKADWGAKTMMRNVRRIITGSEIKFRSRPQANTLREIRDGNRSRK